MGKKPPKRWVEKGPLAPWMTAYGKWLAGHPMAELAGTGEEYRYRYPTGDERVRRASEYAGRQVQRPLITILERRADFREYFERLRSDTQFHARELARDQMARNFDARQKGLDIALEKGDHRELERYTRPFLDHGFPKKENDVVPVQKFTINLFGATPEQKKLLLKAVTEEEPDEIEYEIIESEKTEAKDE